MARLYILRHARSSWAEPGYTDYERVLNDRGNADIPKIARKISQENWYPDEVYCSGALRTRLTIDLIAERLPEFTKDIGYYDHLYSGSTQGYLDTLKSHPKDSDSLMIVGHNPTCESLAMLLAKSGEKRSMETLGYKFPTGALAVIDLAIKNWGEIKEGCGYLNAFILPRELS